MKRLLVPTAMVLAFLIPAQRTFAQVPNPGKGNGQAIVSAEVKHDLSPPLKSMAPAPPTHGGNWTRPLLPIPHSSSGNGHSSGVQSAFGTRTAPTSILNFNGVGNGFTGPAGSFTVSSAPPDPNASVGPNHIVETVNTDFAIFNKSGTAIYGPVGINTLWSGFGGGCQTNNDGDPAVKYDRIADRWVITQFSVSTTPYLQCVAVSQTPDPTGAYYRYAFSYGNSDFPDYPKLSVWPDAYYITFNIFAGGSTFSGARVCAYDRSKMLTGAAATQQCFNTSTSYGGLLSSDLDGSRLPPSGSPNFVLGLGASTSNSLAYWKFHVDWTTPANSTFSGPTEFAVPAYTEACSGGTCIPQSGTTQQLDSLADRLMYRLAYRNFGDHEAMVVDHSVTAGSSAGMRWYELRVDASRNVSLFQSGTYAPDSSYRWMGSIAMDQVGNMAMGFSVSSSSLHPEIHITGRLAGDALGTMTQGESTIINGAGSQTGQGLSRWGDYTSMAVDPSDDCTFFYTDQYIPANGAFNWSTRIGSFKLPGCPANTSNDFSISANPTILSLVQGTAGTSTITTAVTSGSAQSVNLSVSGLPTGGSASFNPTSLTGAGSSTLTITAGASTPAGTYALTVTGTGTSATHSTSVSLTVTAPVTNDFSISANPTTVSLVQGNAGTSTISTATVSGSAQTVALAVSGAPAGTTASVNPTSVTSGASSTLTISTTASTAPGTYTISVTGTGTSATHSTSVSLTVTAPVTNDFSISANPGSLSVVQGAGGSSTISTALLSGSTQTVNLTVSGSPAGTTASLNPTSLTVGGSSTLAITVGSTTVPGSYTLTVTGTGSSATHATSVALTVTAASTGGITNGGFETGNFSGWTTSGAATSIVNSGAHSGTFAGRAGSTSPTNGDSNIAQTFTASAGTTGISFYYKVVCPDTLTYDWATAMLKDNTANVTATLLPKTCTNSGAWVQATGGITAGHSYTLTLTSHDDNYAGDPTYTLFDDATLTSSAPPPSGITNGGFETGSFSGWVTSGAATSIVSAGAHSGTYAGRAGSTIPTNGDSNIAQTFTASPGTTKLMFWYRMTCPDTLTYDWATSTLRDNTTNVTTTILSKTCTNSGAWVQVSGTVTAGHSYTLTLTSHDDNYTGDPTYTLFDDVALS